MLGQRLHLIPSPADTWRAASAPPVRRQLLPALVLGALLAAVEYVDAVRTILDVAGPGQGDRYVPGLVATLLRFCLVDAAASGVAVTAFVHRARAPFLLGLVVIAVGLQSNLALFLAPLALVELAARRRAWETAVAVVVSVAAWLAAILLRTLFLPYSALATAPRFVVEIAQRFEGVPVLVVMGVVVLAVAVALALIGFVIGTNRSRTAALLDREASARRESAANAARARSEERARIAREMHDSLGHHLSLVSLHAGAIDYRDDLDPEQLRAAMTVIGAKTRIASEELRDILGILREPGADGPEPRRTPPALEDVEALVDDARRAGADVDARIEPRDAIADVPHAASVHAYRFLQEALTNAAKHAPGETVHLRATITPGERIDLAAWNAVRTGDAGDRRHAGPGGYGLVGLGERMRLAGGELTVASDAGRFSVTGRLPWGDR